VGKGTFLYNVTCPCGTVYFSVVLLLELIVSYFFLLDACKRLSTYDITLWNSYFYDYGWCLFHVQCLFLAKIELGRCLTDFILWDFSFLMFGVLGFAVSRKSMKNESVFSASVCSFLYIVKAHDFQKTSI
jgi:hypothetical protein